MIGDGMGYNHIEACNNYYEEVQNYQNWDQYRVSTYSKEGYYNSDSAYNDYNYVNKGYTDSGAAATALATGYKTHRGVIGLNENYYLVKNLTEYAEDNGLSSGVVSSVPFNHATPAGFIAHVKSRNFYHDIAIDMLINSKSDVIIGCGNPFYYDNGIKRETPYYKYIPEFLFNSVTSGLTIFSDTEGSSYSVLSCDNDDIPDKWTFISSFQDFEKTAKGINIPKRLFGMPEVFSTLQESRGTTEKNDNIPDLSLLSLAALKVLEQNEDGFFLMIEGGAIDWASHDSSFVHAIEETYDFNKAVEAVVNWVETNSNWDETLVLVTADHETGYLIDSNFINKMKGKRNNYTFEMSSPKNIPKSYENLQFYGGGNGYLYSKCHHTNQLVPLFVKGNGSELFKFIQKEYADNNLNHDLISNSDYIDNTDIAKVIIQIINK